MIGVAQATCTYIHILFSSFPIRAFQWLIISSITLSCVTNFREVKGACSDDCTTEAPIYTTLDGKLLYCCTQLCCRYNFVIAITTVG